MSVEKEMRYCYCQFSARKKDHTYILYKKKKNIYIESILSIIFTKQTRLYPKRFYNPFLFPRNYSWNSRNVEKQISPIVNSFCKQRSKETSFSFLKIFTPLLHLQPYIYVSLVRGVSSRLSGTDSVDRPLLDLFSPSSRGFPALRTLLSFSFFLLLASSPFAHRARFTSR